jgi:hypothetical protein
VFIACFKDIDFHEQRNSRQAGRDRSSSSYLEEERATYRVARVMALSALGFIAVAAIATITFALFSNQRELISKASVLALTSTGIAVVIAGRRSR